jgi:biotin operon repressor
VCNPQNYQGTWNTLIYLAGGINAATGQTFISSEKLAERIGVERDTTDAQLLRLRDAGIVTIQGKQGRSYIRSIMLPCDHLDVIADSHADSSAGSHADTYAERHADTYADTSPHYQNSKRTEQNQQQSDPAAGYSLAEREKFLSQINDGLPKRKQVGLTRQINQLFDSWVDNCVSVGSIIQQLHREQSRWDSGGGTTAALERITDTQAATLKERQPKPVLNPCAGLDLETVCDTMTHTKLGSNDPVLMCPQRKVAS